jgi:putative ABC transport system permease protein
MIDFLGSIGRDLHRALRNLPRRPTFTIATVLTLALGIGATTAIFSVVYSILIKPLPYANPDELVRIRHAAVGINTEDFTSSPSMYLTYREDNETFAALGLWQEAGQTLTGLGEPERLRSLRVTHGVLQALGVQPLRGRWFTEQEHGPAADGPAPVILSHAFWQRRFGGDEAALGRELSIDSQPAQVVGIMPPDFRFDMAPQADVIVAVRIDPARETIGIFDYQMLGRLAPGVSATEARTDLERILPTWLASWPILPGVTLTREAMENWRIAPVVRPLKDDLVGGVASTLWVLMGAIGAVLLVACANVANLMLVRADGRRQELAVRAALGAVPARIARELLVESLVVGAAGGLLGLVLAHFGLQLLVAIGPSNLPRLAEISVHAPVLAFTVAVSLAATLLFGSITAIKHAVQGDAAGLTGARGASSSRDHGATRNTLVVVQVALALVLVISAALMIRTFQVLRDVEPGFTDAATIQTASVWTPNAMFAEPARYTRLQREILEKLAALPGVESAGFARQVPLDGNRNRAVVVVEGEELAAGATPASRRFNFVSPGYFATMGTRIIAGRDLTWSDVDGGARVVMISESLARELAPDPAGALGKRIRFPIETDPWREVIGVVEDVHEIALYEEPPSLVYWPAYMQGFFGRPEFGTQAVTFAIRSERTGTASFVNEIRQTVWSVGSDFPVTIDRTMQDLHGTSLARTSFTLVLLAIAGGMALLLGIIGIYGVIAYVVSQRTREIGIRSALGAEPAQLKRMFVLQGLTLAAIGAAVGLVAAVGLGRAMSSLLFGVDPLDPTAYLAALVVVVLAATLASYLPARRAAAIDPMATLKVE